MVYLRVSLAFSLFFYEKGADHVIYDDQKMLSWEFHGPLDFFVTHEVHAGLLLPFHGQ